MNIHNSLRPLALALTLGAGAPACLQTPPEQMDQPPYEPPMTPDGGVVDRPPPNTTPTDIYNWNIFPDGRAIYLHMLSSDRCISYVMQRPELPSQFPDGGMVTFQSSATPVVFGGYEANSTNNRTVGEYRRNNELLVDGTFIPQWQRGRLVSVRLNLRVENAQDPAASAFSPVSYMSSVAETSCQMTLAAIQASATLGVGMSVLPMGSLSARFSSVRAIASAGNGVVGRASLQSGDGGVALWRMVIETRPINTSTPDGGVRDASARD